MASVWRARADVDWWVHRVALGGRDVPLARLRVKLHVRSGFSNLPTSPEWCYLDTGAPVSVVPFHVHDQNLDWVPLPGVQTQWAGQPCDVGTLDVWLPTGRGKLLEGPFPMLAKFPRSDPPGNRVPILLGLEFFLAHRAYLALTPPPGRGGLRIP
jgi:hypothetical protein